MTELKPPGAYDAMKTSLHKMLADVERAEELARTAPDAYRDGLTSAQRLVAIKAICPRAEFESTPHGWQLRIPGLRTPKCLPAEYALWGHGDTQDAAIDNLWFWLTQRAGGVIVPLGPAQNCWPDTGHFEVWMQWNGFMWFPQCVQSCDPKSWGRR